MDCQEACPRCGRVFDCVPPTSPLGGYACHCPDCSLWQTCRRVMAEWAAGLEVRVTRIGGSDE